jgi:site-specific DNA-methyltransferase (adenine-specific)
MKATELKIELVSIEKIKPYEKNPRINDKAVKPVKTSIEQFGFQQPLVLDKNFVIVVGHTRFKAAQELGLKEVPCVIADNLTESQIKAYRLADNKTHDYSIWDYSNLMTEIEAILEDDFTGFIKSEVFEDIKLNVPEYDFVSESVAPPPAQVEQGQASNEAPTVVLGDKNQITYTIVVKIRNDAERAASVKQTIDSVLLESEGDSAKFV